jgi:hypothetical protein
MSTQTKTFVHELNALEAGQLYHFRDWPNQAVPKVAAGVYTVWNNAQLIYVGMSGRGLTSTPIANHKQAAARIIGLFSRLNMHASGRRSGDQFCVYVSDRLVLPSVTRTQVAAIGSGQASMDELVRNYIHANLSYRYAVTADGATAGQIEAIIRRGALVAGKPLLNPL